MMAARSMSTLLGASRRLFATSSSGKAFEYLSNRPPTKVTTLNNGLKVATEPAFGETASLGVYINAGSAYETAANNGTPKRSQLDLELHVENIGATLNAYTTREHTAYFARVFKNDVATGVDILSDILQNPLLDPRAIDNERSTILTEKETVEKQEEEVVFDHLHSAAFLEDSLGLTILGSDENIKSISRQQLLDYVQTHYSADRMVLVGSGAVDHDQLCSLADKAFASLPKTSKAPKRAAPSFFGALAKDEEDHKPLAYIAFGCQSVEWSHADHFTFMVLQSLLGSWDRSMGTNTSSRVCEKVALNGIAHSVSHFNTCYHSTGIFGVYAVAPEEHLEYLCHTLLHAWPETASHVSENELARAKKRVQAACLSLDGNTAIMEDIGRQMLTLGRRMSAAEVFQRIEAVTSSDIKRICREYLVNTPLAGSALGRVQSLPDYHHLMAYTNPLLG